MGNAAETVDQAVDLAVKLLALKRGDCTNGKTIERALREVASDSRVGFSQLRRLIHPSRRPKSVSLDLWQRLSDCYVRFLRRELSRLQTEIARVEALRGADDAALRELVDEAEALARRIKDHL